MVAVISLTSHPSSNYLLLISLSCSLFLQLVGDRLLAYTNLDDFSGPTTPRQYIFLVTAHTVAVHQSWLHSWFILEFLAAFYIEGYLTSREDLLLPLIVIIIKKSKCLYNIY